MDVRRLTADNWRRAAAPAVAMNRRLPMARMTEFRKVGFIGDYPPRKCGIATFTADLCGAVAKQYPSVDCSVVPVNDIAEGYDYPPEVRFEFDQQDLDSYRRAAD